ncbi:(Fe-S)-binding protein [Paenibacillus albiflavus]|uniref:Glycolate oxidase iron-sulfur subunit n=1 Tax=Paenibacillus albiflavus TaxID=2545760 RepID=A0A4V6P6A7_9BACL|nr:(Fe-S)-binding protein [Paenibacillus albiflavus]TCZ76122.1 (Fe-S)-binding protein [Paenibacillus albiflavus]
MSQTSIKPLVATASKDPLAERMMLSLSYDELTNCMRCGFCQAACPTFKETGYEAASPRGRIALMKAVVDGIMEPDETFRAQMDLCIGCRACEPVCPADVKYGHLIEGTKAAMEDSAKHRWWVKSARNLAFKHVFPNHGRVRIMGFGMKTYQRYGLRWLIRKTGFMKVFPTHMKQMETILPDASSKGVVEHLGTYYPAKGKPIATVGMFRGCIMDVLFTETNINTVKLLSEAGFNVVIPEAQSCCGALYAHSGELEQAKEHARNNIKVFQEADVDYIISNAGGCGALLVEYSHLLHDDPNYAEQAKHFAESVRDVSQIVLEKGNIPTFQDNADEPTPITYQDSCHLRNVMKSSNAPRNLIARAANVKFIELQGSDTCCGSGGIYNLVQPEMSLQILDHKMEHVKETKAHYLLTSNPGCLLQMKLGIERENMSDQMKAVHIVDFLYERIHAVEEK